jgi:hypothetical protein
MPLVLFSTETRDFHFLHSVQTGFMAHTVSYIIRKGSLSPGAKKPGRESQYSPPTISEVKNDSSTDTTIYVFMT